MIELQPHGLAFSFPEVHPQAKLGISFQRTLRIPDGDGEYPLPPGLGSFPLRHVDDFADRVPNRWMKHGGVFFPMYQAEAMWINFSARTLEGRGSAYPFAIRVAAGKVCAVSGERWSAGLHRDPANYVVAPRQPWLDGYVVKKGLVRQFVAMPLGSGYSAEEQVTGEAEHGGLQLQVYPMKRDVFERRYPEIRRHRDMYRPAFVSFAANCVAEASPSAPDMGLAPGGMMRQEVYEDPFDITDWDTDHSGRCFAHIANSLVWRAITGVEPPNTPPTAKEYEEAGLPWFDWYDDAATAIDATEALRGLKSVAGLGAEKGDVPLPENEAVDPTNVVKLKGSRTGDCVREW